MNENLPFFFVELYSQSMFEQVTVNKNTMQIEINRA